MDLAAVMNGELRELAVSCPSSQIESRGTTTALRADTPESAQFFSDAFNRGQGCRGEIWVHTCWGRPEPAAAVPGGPVVRARAPVLADLDADVVTVECASSNGRDLALLGKPRTKKKIAIWRREPHQHRGRAARRRRRPHPPRARHIPPERLIISSGATDCGSRERGLCPADRVLPDASGAFRPGRNICATRNSGCPRRTSHRRSRTPSRPRTRGDERAHLSTLLAARGGLECRLRDGAAADPAPLTRHEYERLVDLGLFQRDSVELIGGRLVVAEPQGSYHATALGARRRCAESHSPPGWIVRLRCP